MVSGGPVEQLLELVLDAPAERALIGSGKLPGSLHCFGEQGFHFRESFSIETVRKEGVPNSVAGWNGGLSSYYATFSL